jgi:hypothetical protein
MLPTSERLQPSLIELGEVTVLVQVKEFKEPTTPPYEEVQEKVLAAVKAEEARKIAETKANELFKTAQANPATFATEAQTRSAKLVGPFEISREESSSDKFPAMTSQMRSAVLGAEKPNLVVGRVFPGTKEFTVLKVEEIKTPNVADSKNASEIARYRTQANQELANNMITSTLELFKSRSTIEIDPSLIAAQ